MDKQDDWKQMPTLTCLKYLSFARRQQHHQWWQRKSCSHHNILTFFLGKTEEVKMGESINTPLVLYPSLSSSSLTMNQLGFLLARSTVYNFPLTTSKHRDVSGKKSSTATARLPAETR